MPSRDSLMPRGRLPTGMRAATGPLVDVDHDDLTALFAADVGLGGGGPGAGDLHEWKGQSGDERTTERRGRDMRHGYSRSDRTAKFFGPWGYAEGGLGARIVALTRPAAAQNKRHEVGNPGLRRDQHERRNWRVRQRLLGSRSVGSRRFSVEWPASPSRRRPTRPALCARHPPTGVCSVDVRVLGFRGRRRLSAMELRVRELPAARRGDPNVRSRSQETIAVSADGEAWFLSTRRRRFARKSSACPPLTRGRRAIRRWPACSSRTATSTTVWGCCPCVSPIR